MNHQVVMTFDYGFAETGIAIGQTITGSARGVATLKMNEGKPRWREVKNIVDEYAPTLLLVGLPLHMDGEESDMSQAARLFADSLTEKTNLPVALQDERLTTKEADARLDQAQETGSARNDHELAACIIFEDWFASTSRS